MTRTLTSILLAGVAGAMAVSSQTRPAFEAVSIKPHPEPMTYSGSSRSGTYARWSAETLRDLIVEAWNLKYYQVGEIGSGLASERFDIAARTDDPPPADDRFRAMLQAMLAERFHLRVHFETREIPVYGLAVAKSGHKLGEPDMNSRIGYTRGGLAKIEIVASHGTMTQLADQLSNSAGRPVLDKTGLTGMFAYTLKFNPSLEESSLPSMAAALQDQLGLRLESQKAPVEMLMIDRAEEPSEN